MAERSTIVPAALQGAYRQWRFAPAVVANGMIHCSGIVGTSPGGETPAELGGLSGAAATTAEADTPLAALVAVRDPEAQFATAFEALRSILVEASRSPATMWTSTATWKPSCAYGRDI
jgi:enamine deaminase RidA (YjgF/YER057c/UK114 family)